MLSDRPNTYLYVTVCNRLFGVSGLLDVDFPDSGLRTDSGMTRNDSELSIFGPDHRRRVLFVTLIYKVLASERRACLRIVTEDLDY